MNYMDRRLYGGRWRCLFLAGIVAIGAHVVFVRRLESDWRLREALEDVTIPIGQGILSMKH